MTRVQLLGKSLATALAWFIPTVLADDGLERFQLYSACQPMKLIIANLSDDAHEIGMTENMVQNTVESRLRSARLFDSDGIEQLFVGVNILSNAFSIRVEYMKYVNDLRSHEFDYSPTWATGRFGTHARSVDFVLSSLSQSIDQFLTEYLRVNEPDCD